MKRKSADRIGNGGRKNIHGLHNLLPNAFFYESSKNLVFGGPE